MNDFLEKIVVESKGKPIIIIGPTASGKTKLAIDLSKKLQIPIYNCDSRQFWKNNQFLSCSPTENEKKEAPHFLFNILENEEKPSLGWWIKELNNNKKIIVGGNMFYIFCLLNGVPILEISKETKEKVKMIEDKKKFLTENCKDFITNLNLNDNYRVERYCENFLELKKQNIILNIEKDIFHQVDKINYLSDNYVIFLNPNKDLLLKKVQKRIDLNLNNWLKEIENYKHENFNSIIGYIDCLDFIDKKINLELLKSKIYEKTLRYIKKQLKYVKKFSSKINIVLDQIYE